MCGRGIYLCLCFQSSTFVFDFLEFSCVKKSLCNNTDFTHAYMKQLHFYEMFAELWAFYLLSVIKGEAVCVCVFISSNLSVCVFVPFKQIVPVPHKHAFCVMHLICSMFGISLPVHRDDARSSPLLSTSYLPSMHLFPSFPFSSFTYKYHFRPQCSLLMCCLPLLSPLPYDSPQ